MENDTAGDGFYATFDGPARAISCALDVVERVRELGIEIRVGVHTGECEVIDGKCAGLTVSIGARVASNAEPSEVLVSRPVKDLVAGSGLAFDDRGEHGLKGVPDRWRSTGVAEPGPLAHHRPNGMSGVVPGAAIQEQAFGRYCAPERLGYPVEALRCAI